MAAATSQLELKAPGLLLPDPWRHSDNFSLAKTAVWRAELPNDYGEQEGKQDSEKANTADKNYQHSLCTNSRQAGWRAPSTNLRRFQSTEGHVFLS